MNIDYFNKYDLEVLDRVEENIKNISDNKLISDFNKLNKNYILFIILIKYYQNIKMLM